MSARRAGFVLVAVGALLALPQIFTATPVVAVFALGLLLALVGGVQVADHPPSASAPAPRKDPLTHA